jgi:hypothetical protein
VQPNAHQRLRNPLHNGFRLRTIVISVLNALELQRQAAAVQRYREKAQPWRETSA